MKYTNQGSSILVFIIVLSGLITITTVVWRTIAYSFDTVIERQMQYQVYYVAQGIHKWGVQFAIDNYKDIRKHIKKGNPIILNMNEWPIHIDWLQEYTCTCSFKYKNSTSLEVVTLFEKGIYKSGVSCILSAIDISDDVKNKFEVKNYKIFV